MLKARTYTKYGFFTSMQYVIVTNGKDFFRFKRIFEQFSSSIFDHCLTKMLNFGWTPQKCLGEQCSLGFLPFKIKITWITFNLALKFLYCQHFKVEEYWDKYSGTMHIDTITDLFLRNNSAIQCKSYVLFYSIHFFLMTWLRSKLYLRFFWKKITKRCQSTS